MVAVPKLNFNEQVFQDSYSGIKNPGADFRKVRGWGDLAYRGLDLASNTLTGLGAKKRIDQNKQATQARANELVTQLNQIDRTTPQYGSFLRTERFNPKNSPEVNKMIDDELEAWTKESQATTTYNRQKALEDLKHKYGLESTIFKNELTMSDREDRQQHDFDKMGQQSLYDHKLAEFKAGLTKEKPKGSSAFGPDAAMAKYLQYNPNATTEELEGVRAMATDAYGNPQLVNFDEDGVIQSRKRFANDEEFKAWHAKQPDQIVNTKTNLANLSSTIGDQINTVRNALDATEFVEDKKTGEKSIPLVARKGWIANMFNTFGVPLADAARIENANATTQAEALKYQITETVRQMQEAAGTAQKGVFTDNDADRLANSIVAINEGAMDPEDYEKSLQYLENKFKNWLGSSLLTWRKNANGEKRLYAYGIEKPEFDVTDMDTAEIVEALEYISQTAPGGHPFDDNQLPNIFDAVEYMKEFKSPADRLKFLREQEATLVSPPKYTGGQVQTQEPGPTTEPKSNMAELYKQGSEGYQNPDDIQNMEDGRLKYIFEDGSSLILTEEEAQKAAER